LSTISTLAIGTITIYQPNYYVLKAAQSSGVKVVLGLFNDSVSGLAQPDTSTNCTYGGQPFPYCGTKYATALFGGACGNVSPWAPATFCESSPSNPNATYVAALNSSAGQFLQNGTVVGIQVGNEILGQQSAATISTAAQNLRAALNAAGFSGIKVIVSLIEGQAASFCSGGAPPAGVDYIADHVYCSVGTSGGVASSPPVWPSGSNPAQTCWTQVQGVFATDQTACGAANVFLGETGYNTGCPNVYGQQQVSNEQTYITQVVNASCQSQVTGPLAPFLFEFGDVCPSGGCLPGCSGQPQEGNGYFGLYFTQDYLTKGSQVSKFTTLPSLICP
jgi:exo-beta-1,3-glucanase (GH17 family)